MAVVRPGTRLWHRHPAVRAHEPTFGEKAADWLKHWFGTWIALGLVTVWIATWIALQRTSISWDLYPFILLNLCLSCLAAVALLLGIPVYLVQRRHMSLPEPVPPYR